MSGRAQTIPGTQLFECHVNHPFALPFCPIHCLPPSLLSAPPCGLSALVLGGLVAWLYKSAVCAQNELHSPTWRVREFSPRTGSVLGPRARAALESELVAFLLAASPGMAPLAMSPTPVLCRGSPWAQAAQPCCWGALLTGWTSQLTLC